MLKFAALFIIAAIVTTSVAMATPVLSLSTNPETYVPGETMEVTITVTSNITDDPQAIGFELWAPEGVVVTQFVDPPNSGLIAPDGSSVEGVWHQIGSPLTAVIEILVDIESTGDIILTSQLFWLDSDDQALQEGAFVPLTISEEMVPTRYHSADTGLESDTPDGMIDLGELLRVIQLYNILGYHCDASGESEDGYIPGLLGVRTCTPHDADYNPQDWMIDMGELLRLIQFYNVGSYHDCPDDISSEDGFCPGA